jgi:hypothetical protein
MSYNATNWAMHGDGNIDTNSFFSFKKYNDLFVNNFTNLTFGDIYRYYLVIMWFGVTCGLSAYTLKQFYLLCVMVWNQDDGEDSGEGEGEDAAVKVPEIAFENRYFTEYDDLEEKDLTDKFVKDLALNVIREETPKGEVLMYYSHELGSFIYYSKTKEIPYKYLETLARKYVIIYDCKIIYIDIRKEYEKGVNKYNEMKENKTPVGGSEVGATTGDDGGAKKKKQIFASFKTYNRKSEVNIKQKDKIYILREKANRYSYRGKIEEYKEDNAMGDEETDEHGCGDKGMEKKIDFSSFKKMNMS